MCVKAFADLDGKLDSPTSEADARLVAEEQIEVYLKQLSEQCLKIFGVAPVLYVCDSCRMCAAYYKISFHVTIANVVFQDVNLQDQWMHSLMRVPHGLLQPDAKVYTANRSLRAVGNMKKGQSDGALSVAYALSSPACARDLHATLVTYPADAQLLVCVDPATVTAAWPLLCNSSSGAGLKRARERGALPGGESKRTRLLSAEYEPVGPAQQEWADQVLVLVRKIMPLLTKGLPHQQVKVQPCNGIDRHSQQMRFTTQMLKTSRSCLLDIHRLDPVRRVVHASNNMLFFVSCLSPAPGPAEDIPVFCACMSTKCK